MNPFLMLRQYVVATRPRMIALVVVMVVLQAVLGLLAKRVFVAMGLPPGVLELLVLGIKFAVLVCFFTLVKPVWAKQPGVGGNDAGPRAATRFGRLFLASERYSAWWYKSEQHIQQRDVDRLDKLFTTGRGRLLIGVWLVGFSIVAVLLSGIDVTRFQVAATWHSPSLYVGAAGLVVGVLAGWLVLDLWVGYRKYAGRLWYFAGIMLLVMVLVTVLLWAMLLLVDGKRDFSQLGVVLVASGGASLLLLLLFVSVVALVSSMRNMEYAVETNELRHQAEKAEAELKLLQAQIEPHFLFNTLGALQHRAEGKAPEAAALAADLIRFLRGSMATLRAEHTTLKDDFALIESYLAVMQARMGDRLRYRVELPAELGNQAVPSMMLLTLVENALKHGLEPYAPGGEVVVTACLDGGSMLLTVADTGRGVSDLPGTGVGLDNIRTRLKLRYGSAARLELEENEPQGFLARLRLPLDSGRV
ncbi:histidine kinase [Chitinimonas viridis]|uniref:Histidine kinase n=1 Tax=Chitinimonas viridis TaxID=664880 RepID=A0ABT8B3J9_9NEIS|nr:histidine kinase [Chitinimonas viridis]MDN3576118.1 histidine kinase [Chitinimonas viridis]